ncbi:uncharacterized protein LOC134826734 [Bolinopsis microptera]|uniref:uncharacterized protein LOC134826734 n=1 Tax=Bolinopsis microptera TaxID=2820187 RepID=UPI003079C88D
MCNSFCNISDQKQKKQVEDELIDDQSRLKIRNTNVKKKLAPRKSKTNKEESGKRALSTYGSLSSILPEEILQSVQESIELLPAVVEQDLPRAQEPSELLPAAVEQDLPRAQESSQLIPATVEHEPRSPTIEPLSPSPTTSISRTHWSPMTSTPTTPFSQVIGPLHNYELMKRVMEDALAPYKQDLEKVKEKTKCYKRELEEVKEEMKSYKRELEEFKEELKCSKRRKRNKPAPGMYQIVYIY